MLTSTAIVTGAGRGIGRATAIELSRRGWAVTLVSRTESDLRQTADACDGEALVCPADVTDAAALANVLAQTLARFGQLDGLVNNAGLAPMLPFEQQDDATFDRVIGANLKSAFVLGRLCWPHLRATKGGIVNVSSMASIDPFPGFSAYAAAKAGLNGLTLALAIEGAKDGIRCHAIAPAGVETAMFRGLPGTKGVPTEKLLDPADVASVIADCLTGPLRHASGETIYLRKSRT